MRIEITGDESISRQARTYAEYRLFAALSEGLQSDRVSRASVTLRRAKCGRHVEGVSCDVHLERHDGPGMRLRACGGHACEAIDRAVERLRRPPRSAAARGALRGARQDTDLLGLD